MPPCHPSTGEVETEESEEFKDILSQLHSETESRLGYMRPVSRKEKLCTEGVPSDKSAGLLSNKLNLVWGTDPLLPASPPAHCEFTFSLGVPKEPVCAKYSSKHS